MDLIRDITRREKIRLALEVDLATEPAAVAPAAASFTQVQLTQEEDVAEWNAPDAGEEPARTESDDDVGQAQPPTPKAFRAAVAKRVPLDDVAMHLPTDIDVPFQRPVPFRDRLGVFLADATPHFSGEFPQPDDGTVSLFPVAFVMKESGVQFRVHARPKFYGKPAYSFVEAAAPGGELWYGRVWLLFRCFFNGIAYNLALVSWLTARPGAPFGTNKPTFSWTSRFTDCIEVEHFTRVVTMVPSYVQRRSGEQVWHLLD